MSHDCPQVIVVDDEPDVLTVLTGGLQLSDIPSIGARSAPDALALLMRERTVKVVVTDYLMPVFDGGWLIRQMGTLETKQPIVLVVTAWEADLDDDIKEKVYRILHKPVTFDTLIAVVREALAEYSLRRVDTQTNRKLETKVQNPQED